MRNYRLPIFLTVLLCTPAARLHAQTSDAFIDPGAAQLVARARSFRDAADSAILSYTGTVRTRLAASLRMPLKDRTLYRLESASRIRWSRDGNSIVKVLAHREQTPAGVTVPGLDFRPSNDELFDPTQDRIYFGLTDNKTSDREDDDIWIEHPLVEGAEQHYRYQSGDTLSIGLQDGRTLRAIELRVLPRVSSGRLVTGSLWIDPANGTVVQALYRLARPLDFEAEVMDEDDREDMKNVPGMFKPITFDITLVAIEYSLHEFKYWLPRVTRLEGNLRAGMFRAPGSYEISYDIEEVVTATPETMAVERAASDSIAVAWAGTSYNSQPMGSSRQKQSIGRVLVPFDTMSLLTSDDLPPPVWEKTPEFISDSELDRMAERLARIGGAASPAEAMRPEITWGLGGADLVRYNRVESLSIGARAATSVKEFSLSATGRLGLGDLHPNLELAAARASLKRAVSLRLHHSLESMDPQADPFGLGNSASALLFGRDDGEYYRASGAALSFAPPVTSRASWLVTLFAQHDEAVERNTNVTLRKLWNGDFRFRANVAAASTELVGAAIGLRPWWGTDPTGLQAGLDMHVEAATGGFEFARARLTARAAAPLVAKLRIGVEAGAGTSAGDVPPQRLWYLGGAGTLRGYDGSTLAGTSFARARVDLARTFGWGSLMVFSDAGWAGDRDLFEEPDVLYSAGVGTSLLDGMVRMDLAHSLRAPVSTRPQARWRLELYLDAVL